MSAAVASLPPALPSTSRSRSRPPRGAVGLGPLPADLVNPVCAAAVEHSSNRTLIETLARSLSRPRQSRPRSPTLTATAGPTALTREEWLASNGGQPWGALGMGARSPDRRESASSSRGRASASTSTNEDSARSTSQQRTRREWSVSRREWVQAGSSSAASAFEVLIGPGSSGEKSASSSRSASPERGRRRCEAGVIITDDEASTTANSNSNSSRSQSRARAVLEKVRRGLRSPRSSSSHASLVPGEEAEEVEPIVPKPAVV